ncbi:MAG TPA: hypothetical protein VMT87_01205, partial [Vicinamibacteria bacterium]|nr:hypothetical protein [Vicinamibacteria bacterium]
DWEACGQVIERRIPGGVARTMANADNFDFGSYLPALNAWVFGPAQAAAISQPVLSVVGAESEQWFVDGHELLHHWFPQVEDCRVEGVAHLLHLRGRGRPPRGARPRPNPTALQIVAAVRGEPSC